MSDTKAIPQLLLFKGTSSSKKQNEVKVKLEKKIQKIEKEFKNSVLELQTELKKALKESGNKREQSKMKAELKRLNQLLESKIAPLSHPISSEKKAAIAAPKANSLRILNHFLSKIFSIKTYRNFLLGSSKYDHLEFDEFGRDPQFEKKAKPFFDFLYYQYWRVNVEGLENIPNDGSALIVANHSGTLPFDGSMIRMAVSNDHPSRRDVRFLVEDFVYYLPFLGTFMYRIGGVRADPRNAERLLRKGHLVTVFPEGEKGIGKTYKHRYHLQRFGRGGFIKLILKTGAPIIPCAVIGAEETHPLLYRLSFLAKPFGIPYVPITPTLPWGGLLGLIGLPAKWSIYFGKPIDLSSYGPEAAEDELLVHRLSEEVRQNIQEMIMEGLKKRRSVWWG
ncbi:MAG: 1-acyl-sn-glycerol-3-phosphate acyltransferase [Deltaproteobacteria bacterium]|nr:1-acyl-sn-glycerol-3-phosphate acyltransferase [Deltaproteobacteria bacterium]